MTMLARNDSVASFGMTDAGRIYFVDKRWHKVYNIIWFNKYFAAGRGGFL